ncbi:MAG: hypothetical protein VKK62_04205 [Synechococcaceae cyanobacterium]|nr:hypothetical protein [Synechococcaceae cyanobacterium]
MTNSVLDLLRERRRDLGHPSMSGLLLSRPPLLRRGLVIGSAVVGVMVGAIVLVFLYHEGVKFRMAQLQQVEVEAEVLKSQVEARKREVSRLENSNQTIAEALTKSTTSSGLLATMQLLTPAGVQLETVESRPTELVVKGRAEDPRAFSRINALQLALGGSPLMEPKALAITKVERINPASGSPGGTPATAVSFQINGPFAKLPPNEQLKLLRRLNSEGMARRLARLQSEGLL